MYSYKAKKIKFVERGMDSYTLLEVTAFERGKPAATSLYRHYPSGKVENDEAVRMEARNIEVPMEIRTAIYVAMLP